VVGGQLTCEKIVQKKIVQKSEIEWLEGMMRAGNTNRMCCGGGTINMCSPCGVCFQQMPLTWLSIKTEQWLSNIS